ncbi:methyltransferase domain-containing protein [Microbispora sp. RL4-1S]|uniref:Methyltransferase domain-containing protein n=1 Tax=Microbispora oryzae TaxID=2806554 RepID=A0A940WMK3_9ACTN|nr:class I SAM-dependent methyltransferase [Microbispora oryzae]MBP2708410.1 methyltransferase domain-containing protein [Microbispora oryzae]
MHERSLAETRAFFAAKADTWEEKYPDDGPAFAAAVAELALPPGGLALDAGCGTARAFVPLRDAVGPAGRVVGVDVTPEMLRSARDRGRGAYGRLLLADVGRLPLGDGVADGVLASGLISHVPRPEAALRELARVTREGGRLALFHPVGRAVLAARRGRVLTPDDVRAEANLRPLLSAAGWTLLACHDTDDRYLAVAGRRPAGKRA